MSGRSAVWRVLPVINLLVLISTCGAALLTRTSAPTRAGLAAAGLAGSALALVVFRATGRRAWIDRASGAIGPLVRALAMMAPWLALWALCVLNGLWWTQRPMALRAFIVYALANWSVAVCVVAPNRPRLDPLRRATVWLAFGLGVIGLEGLAFGVTPFGCAASALLAAAAAFAVWVGGCGRASSCLKLLTLSAATLCGLATIEVAMRVLRLGANLQEVDSRELVRAFYSLTPPGTAFVNAPTALDEFAPALVEINTRGIRGPEIAEARADVLLIGDSMIEARQLTWEETLGPRLRQALETRSIAARVVSHGMRGWSPLLEWNWYLKVGRRFSARTVLLFFFWNDLWPEGDERSTFGAVLRGDGRPDYFDVPVDADWIWYKHVRLLRLAGEVSRRASMSGIRRAFSAAAHRPGGGALDTPHAQARARELNEPPLARDELHALLTQPEEALSPSLRTLSRRSFWPAVRPWHLWSDRQRAAAAVTELELQRFAEDVKADGGRLSIVHVPHPLQISPAECSVGRLFERIETDVVLPPESGIQTWLRDVSGRLGLDLIDPSDAMREYHRATASADPLYLRADCHWSARGHAFMAGLLANWYAQQEPPLP